MASMKWNTAVLTSILNETNQSLVKVGFRLERDIKKSFGPGTGRVYMTGKNKDISHQASTPGDPPAVDTGRLRASISTNWTDSGMARGKVDGKAEEDDGVGNPGHQQGLFRVVVGTNVEYACVSAATSVLTEKGRKRISLIKPGEKVLTQTGEFHPVLALIKRAKAEVPGMVTIKIEWRNGNRTHKITTTKDHKFLVFREGKNKWVIADELKETDLLFSRKKFEKRKGVSKFGELFCRHCYICNPDINSYVNLSIFEAKKIISIKKWEYKNLPSGKAKGVRTAYVYDLSIENVHSYYANGILVSNSFLEFGTSRMAARPFMRPAMERIRSQLKSILRSK